MGNKSWSVEMPTVGHCLILKRNELCWSSYDLPSTSHSSGGENTYPLASFTQDSKLYLEVVQVFGISVAQEVLDAVTDASSDPDFKEEHSAESLLKDWLQSLPEEVNLELPWTKGVPSFPNNCGDDQELEKINILADRIKVSEYDTNLRLTDRPTRNVLKEIAYDNSIQFAYLDKSNNPLRVVMTRQHFIVIIGKLTDLNFEVLCPLEFLLPTWKTLYCELNTIFAYEGYLLLRFWANRIQSSKGDFLLKFDLNSLRFTAKRTIVPIPS